MKVAISHTGQDGLQGHGLSRQDAPARTNPDRSATVSGTSGRSETTARGAPFIAAASVA